MQRFSGNFGAFFSAISRRRYLQRHALTAQELAERQASLVQAAEEHNRISRDLERRAQELAGLAEERAALREQRHRLSAERDEVAAQAREHERAAAELDVREQALARASDELSRRTREHESRSAEVVSTVFTAASSSFGCTACEFPTLRRNAMSSLPFA